MDYMTPTSAPALPFMDIMASHVNGLRDKKQGQRFARDGWTMSGTGSCHRKRVIERAHEAGAAGATLGDFRTESLIVFEYGDRVEDFAREAINAWLGNNKQVVRWWWQKKVGIPHLNVSGTFDLLIEWERIGGTYTMHDVKSASGKSFEWAITKGSENNKKQLAGYAAAAGWGVELDPGLSVPVIVSRTSLLYLNKEYGDVREVEFDWRELWPEVEQDYKTLNEEWVVFGRENAEPIHWSAEDAKGSEFVPPMPLMDLPAEVPFGISSGKDKHAQAGRAKKGDAIPHGLCSPLYCRAIHHCPIVSAFWRKHTQAASAARGY